MVTAQDPDGTYTLTYDAADRVSHVDEPFGLGLTFAYDPVGNRTGVQDSTGGVTTVVFDALDRPTGEQVGGAGVAAMRADTAYDAAGQITARTRYSDLSGTAVVGTTAYGYDGAGRATGIQTADGAGLVLANYTYAYDTAGRLSSKTEDGVTTSYAYDAAGQLTQDGPTGFSYDANGNRNMAGYATGAGNRTTTDGTWTYTYDAEGNVSGKTDAAGDAWVYGYDNNNQMVSAAYTPAGSGSATQLVTYGYDAFGNRIQRQAWDGSTTTTQRYGLDGWDTAQPDAIGNENFDTWAVLDGSNSLASRNLSDPDFGAPVAVETAAGAVSWYATDLQGSVRTVLDNSGSVTSTIAYDAFGNTTSGTVPGYGYTGQRQDAITLYYSNGNGIREYDPASGVWMQEDPWNFSAGDPNLRRYVGNSPTDATDPSGLQPPGLVAGYDKPLPPPRVITVQVPRTVLTPGQPPVTQFHPQIQAAPPISGGEAKPLGRLPQLWVAERDMVGAFQPFRPAYSKDYVPPRGSFYVPGVDTPLQTRDPFSAAATPAQVAQFKKYLEEQQAAGNLKHLGSNRYQLPDELGGGVFVLQGGYMAGQPPLSRLAAMYLEREARLHGKLTPRQADPPCVRATGDEMWLVPGGGLARSTRALTKAEAAVAKAEAGAVKRAVTAPVGLGRQIGYGSSDLSRAAQAYRQTAGVTGGRNVAVFEYRAADGSLQTIARASERGVGHAERIIARELEAMGVQPSQVTRIYSELQPCNVPGGYCDPFIRRTFPQAEVSWSFEYGATAESRAAGVEALRRAAENLGR